MKQNNVRRSKVVQCSGCGIVGGGKQCLDAILRKRGYKDAFVIDKEMGLVNGLAWQPSVYLKA